MPGKQSRSGPLPTAFVLGGILPAIVQGLKFPDGQGGLKVPHPVIWCDTEISVQVISDPKELEPQGGGGTMFSPVFKWVNKNKPQTKGVVYVTDGYCSDFGPEPEYPVLWVLTQENQGFQPPFGEVVCVID